MLNSGRAQTQAPTATCSPVLRETQQTLNSQGISVRLFGLGGNGSVHGLCVQAPQAMSKERFRDVGYNGDPRIAVTS